MSKTSKTTEKSTIKNNIKIEEIEATEDGSTSSEELEIKKNTKQQQKPKQPRTKAQIEALEKVRRGRIEKAQALRAEKEAREQEKETKLQEFARLKAEKMAKKEAKDEKRRLAELQALDTSSDEEVIVKKVGKKSSYKKKKAMYCSDDDDDDEIDRKRSVNIVINNDTGKNNLPNQLPRRITQPTSMFL